MSTLEQKIASALVDRAVTSDMLGKLITETEQAIAVADVTAKTERKRALDPAVSADPIKARQSMEEAAFAAERLRTQLPRLQTKYNKVLDAEEYAAWIRQFEQVKPRHTAAAAKLKAVYVEFEGKLVEALKGARAVDAEVGRVEGAKPYMLPQANGDGKTLPSVECAARGVTGVAADFSIMNLKLPAFDDPTRLAWPPPTVPIGVQFAAIMTVPSHPGADWHATLVERGRARQQESARVAAHYASMAKEREDREAREARAARSS